MDIPERDLTPYLIRKSRRILKEPKISMPNIYCSSVPDHRELVLQRIKREQEYLLNETKNPKPY